jgi:glycosyltransferase involved in cell wall biosynthesis
MENSLDSSSIKRVAMFSIHSDPLASLGSQESGGQNIYVRCLAEQLGKLGWHIDIFTRLDSSYKKELVFLGKHVRIIRLKGGPPCYIPKKELISLLPEIFNNFLTFINRHNPYLLFHGHYWDGGWMALRSHFEFSAPFIENFHSLGMVRFETKRRYFKNGNEQDYEKRRIDLEKNIIQHTLAIISLSETEKNDLINLYGSPAEKITVIPGGVNLKQFVNIPKDRAREKLSFDKTNFILLYVGRLEWRKGIGTLISAVKLLKKEIPNIKAVIVGGRIYGNQKNKDDFKEYQRLLKKAKEEEVAELIQFVGRVNNEQLPLFYSAADIFVIPSYYEPFGLVALEAMASRIPIIASRVGGLQTIIQDGKTGLLFEPRNPLDLRNKALQLQKSKDLSNIFIENAYQNVAANYSWKNIAIKINNIYKSLT